MRRITEAKKAALEAFGFELAYARKQVGMTQRDVAAEMGISVDTLRALERGDRMTKCFLRLAKKFDLEIPKTLKSV